MGLIANLRKAKEKILCKIKLQKNHVKVGKNISFRGVPLIYTPNGGLTIGNDTRINSGIMYNAIGGNQETSFVTKENGSIVIGKNVGISNTAFVAQTNITVEDDVLIGGDCCIYDTDFHSIKYEERMDKRLVKYLKKQFKVHSCDMYAFNGPLDLTFLMKCYGIEGFEDLKEAPYIPQKNKKLRADKNIFNQIRKGDVLLHHPYESFDPIVAFIKQAAEDENVLAIKQTLYRVSGHSPIIAALAQAAENGKQVTVLVELKARFDEENNINWARKLEKAGCHVIYGLVGLKTHCKIALVVRREADGIRRYVHLGTGNYNDSTAKLYTDTGMFTCRNAVGEDATAVFNMLSGYSEPANWNQLIVAPIWMKKRFLEMIARETQNAKEGKPARIIAKCNSLCDRKIILALYEASCAGVQIDLIVRGICCLVAGKPGVSENIRVRSIVGTFLEHARIFYFYNDGNEEVYMGSADWMPRNLDRRVEIVFPVEAPDLKEKAKHILDVQLRDTLKAHCLLEDGTYRKVDRRGKEAVEAQKTFCEEAIAAANESKEKVRKKRTFDPLFSPQEAE